LPGNIQSSLRRWHVAIAAGIVVFGGLIGFRLFLDYRAGFPIVDPYLSNINAISSQSPRARQRLEQYYAEHRRQTVASKHYPGLCDAMQKLARRDGIAENFRCPTLIDKYEKP
jgi:hypothetical protein